MILRFKFTKCFSTSIDIHQNLTNIYFLRHKTFNK